MKQCGWTEKDIILEKYLALSSKVYKRREDYLKIKASVHNRAMRQLIALDAELSEKASLAEVVYGELLKNEDEYIQWSAAACCLRLGVLTEESLNVLDNIIASGDQWMTFHAKRTLKIWRGEIDPTQPDFD